MKGDKHEGDKGIQGQHGSILDTDDWEFVLIGTYAAGNVLGGGGFTFGFRSRTLKQYMIVIFAGAGVGAGILASWNLNAHQSRRAFCTEIPWMPLKQWIKSPFSASNLCNATGRVTLAAIGTLGSVGFGLASCLVVTARYTDDETGVSGFLFDKATIYSFFDPNPQSGGVGGVMLWGKWTLREEVEPAQLNTDWTQPTCDPRNLDPEVAPPLPSFPDRVPYQPLNKRINSERTPRDGAAIRESKPL